MSALGPKLIDPNSITKTWGEKEILAPGIVVYKNVLKKEIDIPNKLESVLMSTSNPYKWREATVGYGFKKPEYRDCVDFKFRKDDLHNNDDGTEILKDMWQQCYDVMSEAVKDYCIMYNITELQYWEVMNFIRYHEGQHFEEHTDHGYSYTSTVSLVGYINDNYKGGGLYFRLQDIMFTPEEGDLVVFPSNFMYPHKAMPVTEGTKYSVVTMLDYTDRGHVVSSQGAKPNSFLSTK